MANETAAEARRRRELKAIEDFKKLKPAPDKKRKRRATASDSATQAASTPPKKKSSKKSAYQLLKGRSKQIDEAVKKAKGE